LGSWERDRTAFDDGLLKARDRSLLGKMPQNGNGQTGA
jgi:hypothetical protein